MVDSILEYGSVHGRFQPLHLEHLEYIEMAFERCKFLYVGLTRPDHTTVHGANSGPGHRTDLSANPLTYFERQLVISKTLVAMGYDRSRFSVIPFPIESPSVLGEYLPVDITVFTTRVDDWNDYKIETLEGLGYAVEVLKNRNDKAISGERIRQLLSRSDDSWQELVHPTTAEVLASLNISDRLVPSCGVEPA